MKRSQSGFSMMQMVIGIGVMGIGMVALMDTLKLSTDATKSTDENFEITSSLSQINNLLSSQLACKNTFFNADLTDPASAGGNPTVLKNPNNTNSKFEVNKALYSGIKINSISMDVNAKQLIDTDTYIVPLNIAFQRKKTAITKKIDLRVIKDNGSNIIVDCASAGQVSNMAYTSTCNAQSVGATKYNSVLKTLEFCDGTSWKELSLNPSKLSGTKGLRIEKVGQNIKITADEVVLRKHMSEETVFFKSVDVSIGNNTVGLNGINTGSISPGTWYYFWLISDGENIAGMVTNLESKITNRPEGYDYYLRVGSVRTQGTWFPNFYQLKNKVTFLSKTVPDSQIDHTLATIPIDLSKIVSPIATSAEFRFQCQYTGSNNGKCNYKGMSSIQTISQFVGDQGYGKISVMINYASIDLYEPQKIYAFYNGYGIGAKPKFYIEVFSYSLGGNLN